MIIKRWSSSRKCWVHDVRLINEFGRKQLFPAGHTSIKKVKEYEQKLKNEIAEKKMFPERFPVRIKFQISLLNILESMPQKRHRSDSMSASSRS